MKNIDILLTNYYSPKYYIKYSTFWKTRYLWQSPETEIIHELKNSVGATEFNSREEALIVAEKFLNQKKSK